MNEVKQLTVNVPKILGIPAKKKFSLGLVIKRYTTNVNGAIILDSAVPDNMAVAYPFHIFGEFDRQGGFAIADRLCSPVNNTKLFGVYVWGVNTPLFFFNPLADINSKFQKGDLIFIYVDDLTNPNYFSFVQVNSIDGAYASIVSQTMITQLSSDVWGAFKMFEMQMQWVDDRQLNQIFYTIDSKFDSQFTKNTINPYEYYNPDFNKQKKIILPYQSVINQYIGLSSFIDFSNSMLNLSIILYV